ncbi:MAG: hypothetical protein ACM3VT_08195 [Solirubrobacterales bacterium]
MRNRAFLAAAMSLLWLSGCGGGGNKSVEGLRTESHKAYSFEVDADCQTVYGRIFLRARQRYVYPGMSIRQPGVSAELSPDNRSGTITLWDSGGIGFRYRLIAEIQTIEPARVRIDLFTATKRDRGEARLWAGWADTAIETPAAPENKK